MMQELTCVVAASLQYLDPLPIMIDKCHDSDSAGCAIGARRDHLSRGRIEHCIFAESC